MLNIPLKTVWENETDRRAETFSQISQHYSQPVRKLFPKAHANVEGISRHMVKSLAVKSLNYQPAFADRICRYFLYR